MRVALEHSDERHHGIIVTVVKEHCDESVHGATRLSGQWSILNTKAMEH